MKYVALILESDAERRRKIIDALSARSDYVKFETEPDFNSFLKTFKRLNPSAAILSREALGDDFVPALKFMIARVQTLVFDSGEFLAPEKIDEAGIALRKMF